MSERELFRVSVKIIHKTNTNFTKRFIVNTYSTNDAIDLVLKSLNMDGFTASTGYAWMNINVTKLERQTEIVLLY